MHGRPGGSRKGSIRAPRRDAPWEDGNSLDEPAGRRESGWVKRLLLAMLAVTGVFPAPAQTTLFEEPFQEKLQEGWSWRRENKAAWRVVRGALEIRIEPGNMWGPANDAKNVLMRALPEAKGPLEISLTVSNQPTAQYEQVDLVAYFDDSHMVKIGFELVDGRRCIVMGREEKDRTRTIAIIPLQASEVQLRLRLEGTTVRGAFRPVGVKDWREAGQCDLPGPGRPNLAIQCYQGPANAEHWARISQLVVRELNH